MKIENLSDIFIFIGIILSCFVLAHLVNWLLVKGIIWFMMQLFNINWYGKFWAVYSLILTLEIIFGTVIKKQ